MNIKHLFFCMLLVTFSSCSKPGYEKAIAEWVQTDSNGTWTDLKFELLEVLETEDVTVSDSLRYLNNKSAQLSAVIQKAESYPINLLFHQFPQSGRSFSDTSVLLVASCQPKNLLFSHKSKNFFRTK